MKECKNCGMPMIKKEDFGNNDPKSVLCRRCFSDKSINVEIAKNNSTEETKITKLEDLSKLNDIDDIF